MESGSIEALRRVVDWAHEQGMSIRGLLSEEQLLALGQVLRGAAPWSFELYEPLRALSHALPRLELPDLPARLQFGDILSALEDLLARDAARGWGEGAYGAGLAAHDWQTAPMVSAQGFAELGYAATSAGISRLRERHTAAWREHAVRNKEVLLEAARDDVSVIGAGKLYDIPLRKLTESCAHVVLVDVDGDSLAASLEQAGLAPRLRERVSTVTADVTGINDAFLRGARACFALDAEDDVYRALLGFLYSYRLQEPPELPHGAVALSSMVLSQLATPLTEHVQARYRERFPDSERSSSRELGVALAQFTHRVQHDHLRALLHSAQGVAVTSDVSEQYTQFAGTVSATSPPLPLIGAPHLEELFPAQTARVTQRFAWQWERIAAGPTRASGRLLQVHGCFVTPKRNQ
jgi:hypothetical protein